MGSVVVTVKRKNIYTPPEFELLKIKMLYEILSPSLDDINHDTIDNGDGDDLFGDDDSNPDSNFDDFDLGDGEGLFD